jgi:Arc/MetJ-type ribon-helix-helix transcriptional regulator
VNRDQHKNNEGKQMETVIVGTRVPKSLKEKMDQLVEKGLYINISDLLRDVLRQKFKEDF